MFEVAFVDVDPDQTALLSKLWREADETMVPLEQRELYSANGLRWGVVGPMIPPSLQELIKTAAADTSENAAIGRQLQWQGSWGGSTARQLQLRDGRSATIIVEKPADEPLVLLWRDEQSTRGIELQQAECQFELKTHHIDGGSVELTLIPRVAHGTPRAKMVGHEGTWMVQTERERLVLEPLALSASLSPGQVLVIGATSPPRAVGGSFFARGAVEHRPQRILLIRLANAPPTGIFETAPNAD